MAIHKLLSRAVEAGMTRDGSHEDIQISGWTLALLISTFGVFLILTTAIDYTYGLLVPVLAMVEETSTVAAVRTSERYHDDDNPDAPLLSKEEKEFMTPEVIEEVVVVKNVALTAKFRTIIKHLKERTGSKLSRFRAVGGYILYSCMVSTFVSGLCSLTGLRSWAKIMEIPVVGLLCLQSTAWVHQAVAMPGKSWFQRGHELYEARVFKKLFFPVVGVQVVQTAVNTLPRQMSIIITAIQAGASDKNKILIVGIGAMVTVVVFLTSYTLAVVPLNIALVRLQASYLPEESESIIPMDRSLGGTAEKTLRSAWKSFTREGLWRIIKVWVKYVMIQVVLAIGFAMILVGELRLTLDPKTLQALHDQIAGFIDSARMSML